MRELVTVPQLWAVFCFVFCNRTVLQFGAILVACIYAIYDWIYFTIFKTSWPELCHIWAYDCVGILTSGICDTCYVHFEHTWKHWQLRHMWHISDICDSDTPLTTVTHLWHMWQWHVSCSRDTSPHYRITAPRYLSDYCIPVATLSGRSHLRSAASGSLFVPACRTVTIGPRAFAVACPKSWNSLPQDLRVPGITQGEFRNRLKTVLFEEMLSGRLWNYFSHSSEQLFLYYPCYI